MNSNEKMSWQKLIKFGDKEKEKIPWRKLMNLLMNSKEKWLREN